MQGAQIAFHGLAPLIGTMRAAGSQIGLEATVIDRSTAHPNTPRTTRCSPPSGTTTRGRSNPPARGRLSNGRVLENNSGPSCPPVKDVRQGNTGWMTGARTKDLPASASPGKRHHGKAKGKEHGQGQGHGQRAPSRRQAQRLDKTRPVTNSSVGGIVVKTKGHRENKVPPLSGRVAGGSHAGSIRRNPAPYHLPPSVKQGLQSSQGAFAGIPRVVERGSERG